MHTEPSITESLYIPDEITDAYADDAAWQVSESRTRPPSRASSTTRTGATAALSRTTLAQRRCIVAAVSLILTGLGLCTAWWTSLAISSDQGIWTVFSFGGGTLWVLATAVALSFRFPPTSDAPAAEPVPATTR